MPGIIEISEGEGAGLFIGLTEKGGCTSIQQSVKGARKGRSKSLQETITRQYPVRIYLRHPLKRLISAWRYFHPALFPRESGVPAHAPYEEFVDCVLQPLSNEHWNPQLRMYEGCNITEIYRFENIAETWPRDIPLRHLNSSYYPPPTLEQTGYRLAELQEFFAEDFAAWNGIQSASVEPAG